MSELTKRILFAIPAAAIFLYVMWLGGTAFETLVFGIALLTAWEVHRIMGEAGAPDFFPISLILTVIIWRSAIFPDWALVAIIGALLLFTIIAILDRSRPISARWLSTLFTGIYAPVGFLMVIYIREMGVGVEGFWLTLSLFLMIWGNDVFAYFGGKTFGKRPLAPKISPKKTWEGFWFGFLGAAVGFLIAWFAGDLPLTIWAMIPAVAIVSILGPIGDITASRLKRLAEVKDSSNLLPGHGGFFDRFDSLILTAPFIFFLYLMLVGSVI
ncbi:MAG: phosphatidate cytidylyltransferase [Balneolaceae bacterium]|nr:phosphatidate cytidylyltransferase [Balneolaceae bacterium]